MALCPMGTRHGGTTQKIIAWRSYSPTGGSRVNNLTGELPKNLGSWSDFNFIDVSTNALTGAIPPDMCKRGTMQKLLMLENKFSGAIPASYAS